MAACWLMEPQSGLILVQGRPVGSLAGLESRKNKIHGFRLLPAESGFPPEPGLSAS